MSPQLSFESATRSVPEPSGRMDLDRLKTHSSQESTIGASESRNCHVASASSAVALAEFDPFDTAGTIQPGQRGDLHNLNSHDAAIRSSAVSLARVPPDEIVYDPSQPRRHFDLQSLDRLAASIQEHGLKNPIRVRWEPSLRKYMILSGERRYRAARQAGLQMIDCMIVEGELTEADRLEEQLTENLLREDLNPIERARGIRALMKAKNWNQKQLSEHLQIETSGVTRSLALLNLPEKIQKLVEEGALAPRAAYEITKLQEPDDQLEVANMVVDQDLDIRATEKLVNRNKEREPIRKQRPTDQKKFRSENPRRVEREPESKPDLDSFPILLKQYNHPGGHIASIIRADRDDIPLIDQINTLQAHILLLKRAGNEKRGV